ncbi:MAG: carboxypeptidase-like regulatory domain-containing protein [Candidatus Roizmanbacteria bacterium]|nr:carboxypeptidase-like regulatory domain-containing protein [Candidatus Roizmanbacteria bacterium]
MKKKLLLLLIITLFFAATISKSEQKNDEETFWIFQSIDTMKYSRDISREKLNDPSFNTIIDDQVKNIADTGATHVALATPYDTEFIPILKRWVAAARKYNLKVWFRGNWSGWEGWFNYPKINRSEHIEKTYEFIIQNNDLFQDGDIFTACPECENGGPGDPRLTSDTSGHRAFLIEEYEVTQKAFGEIDTDVKSNFNSMNGDVARLIMDKETTRALGGTVVIDHYVASPDQLVSDISDIAKNSGGQVVLGEFGAPIEDINGKMTEDEQAAWLDEAFSKMVQEKSLIGVNYWVNVGGSTQLWNSNATPRKAVTILTSFYNPSEVQGIIKDEIGRPIADATIRNLYSETVSDSTGSFSLPFLDKKEIEQVNAEGYSLRYIDYENSNITIILAQDNPSLLYKTLRLFKQSLKIK